MDKMRKYSLSVVLVLFSVLLPFAYDLSPAEAAIKDGEYDAALEYLSGFETQAASMENAEEFLKYEALTYYYRALALYKKGDFEAAYEHMEKAMENNDKKLGFNILMGFIIIGLGEEAQGIEYLKRASLLEGIRPYNSLSLDDGNYSLKKRAYYMIRSVNRIDPQGVLDFFFYHSYLLGYYKRINRRSSLGVEYEKLILHQMSLREQLETEYSNVKNYFEELIELYRSINYFDSLAFVLDVYTKRYAEFLSDEKILEYNILSARINLSNGSYIEAKKSYDMILVKDLKGLSDEILLEYFDVGLLLYYNFNISEMIYSLLERMIKMRLKNIPVDKLNLFASYAMEIGEYDIAYRFIRTISKNYPDNFMGYLLLSQYYLVMNREEEALILLQQVKNMPEENYRAHYEYGRFLFDKALGSYIAGEKETEQLEQAVQELEKAAEYVPKRAPETASIFLCLGKAYYLSGIKEGLLIKLMDSQTLFKRDSFMEMAESSFSLALKYSNEVPDAYEFRGWSNIYLRRFDEAFEDFKEMLKADPFSGEAAMMIKYIKSTTRGER